MCSSLPAEIWASIFTFTDDFTLWVSCRQVTRMLRAEAEREFARTRLCKLRFKWDYSHDFSHRDQLLWCEDTATGGTLVGISDDFTTATYNFDISSFWYTHDFEFVEEDPSWSPSSTKQTISNILHASDKDLQHRLRRSAESLVRHVTYECELNAIVNDVEIPGLAVSLDAGTMSFPWKAFLDKFFADTAYVLRRYPNHTHDYQDFDTSLEGMCANFGADNDRSDSWVEDFGAESDEHFVHAYMERIERARRRSAINIDEASAMDGVDEYGLWEGVREFVTQRRQDRNFNLWWEWGYG
jgi:hypothetical protein